MLYRTSLHNIIQYFPLTEKNLSDPGYKSEYTCHKKSRKKYSYIRHQHSEEIIPLPFQQGKGRKKHIRKQEDDKGASADIGNAFFHHCLFYLFPYISHQIKQGNGGYRSQYIYFFLIDIIKSGYSVLPVFHKRKEERK